MVEKRKVVLESQVMAFLETTRDYTYVTETLLSKVFY